MNQPKSIRLVRAIEFSAALRYFDSSLSVEDNRAAFGSLYRDKGFGANFRIEAYLSGPVDPLTGMIINLVEIDRWLKTVTSIFDGKFLNELSEVFGAQAPTPERIARYCYLEMERLVKAEAPAAVRLEKVRLFEGETLSVTYSRS